MSAIIATPHATAASTVATRSNPPDALWGLADEFRPSFLKVAARAVGSDLRPKLDAADVVQDALLAAFARRAQFRGHDAGQWHHWVSAIVRNQARKAHRYWRRGRRDFRRERPLAPEHDRERPPAAWGGAPSHRAAHGLPAALQRLTPDHRQVLQLRTFEELSFDQVAARMNRSPEAVRKLWTRAVRSLREKLGEEW